jgi:hypothetical protein
MRFDSGTSGGAVVEEYCYAMKRRLPANQGGGDDANVIF